MLTWERIDLASPGKLGKNGSKNWKNGQQRGFGRFLAIFPCLGNVFPVFHARPKSISRTIFFRAQLRWGGGLHMGKKAKTGRFGFFFVLCFLGLEAIVSRCFLYQDLGHNAKTQNLPHFRAFPASIRERSSPKCLSFMANARLPNRPGFTTCEDLQRQLGPDRHLGACPAAREGFPGIRKRKIEEEY